MYKGFTKLLSCVLLLLSLPIVAAQAKLYIPDNIVQAIKKGDTNAVKAFLQAKPEYMYARHKKLDVTMLGLAAMEAQPAIVQELLGRAKDPKMLANAKSYGDVTPLMLVLRPLLAQEFAIKHEGGKEAWEKFEDEGHERIRKLVAQGTKHKEVCPDCIMHKLIDDTLNQRIAIVKMLIAAGADVDAVNIEGDDVIDISFETPAIFDLLVAAGAKIDVKKKNKETGETALHYAALSKKAITHILKQLLQLGADLEAKNEEGQTPLMFAANSENIIFLVQQGAKINAKDKDYSTVLHHLVMSDEVDVADRNFNKAADLIISKSDVEAKKKNGDTPLMVASAEMTPILLQRGARINTRDKNGNTALSIAIFSNDPKKIKILLEKGADVKTKDNKGQTSLHLAVELGSIEVLRVLLDAINLATEQGKAVLEMRDELNFTPLLFAAWAGNLKAVQELLDRGANIDALDNRARTIEQIVQEEIKVHEEALKYAQGEKKEKEEKEEKEDAEVSDYNHEEGIRSSREILRFLQDYRQGQRYGSKRRRQQEVRQALPQHGGMQDACSIIEGYMK